MPHPLEDEEGFIAALEAQSRSRQYALLMAGSDASLLAVSRARERLSPVIALGLPAHDVVERALSKPALIAAASNHGLAAPRSELCSTLAEGISAARQYGFPVVVKPSRSVVEREQARVHLGSMQVADEHQLTTAVAACGDRFVVQRNEPGAVLSYAGVYAHGRLIGEALSRYHRTWHPDAGNACFSETIPVPVELRTRAVSLVEELCWEGIFELELIEREDGGWAAIDFNPRPYGSLALAIRAGANLPALWCASEINGRTDVARARPGVFYRWGDADIRYAMWQLRRRKVADGARALAIRRDVVHPYYDRHDPGPFVARAVSIAKVARQHGETSPPGASAYSRLRPALSRRAASVPDSAPVAIIGAGPYGLAAAAHLRAAGVATRCFGEPLDFWRRQMPAGMLLRSPRSATEIADPGRRLGIDPYEASRGTTVRRPTLRLEEFIDYGTWFQRQVAPELDPRRVASVSSQNGHFLLELEDGDRVEASRVVVATGLASFARRPEPFVPFPPSLVSHTSDHHDLSVFAGKRVVVLGGGQSAVESAALLVEQGAEVELLVRGTGIRWLPDDTKLPYPPEHARFELRPPPTGVGGKLNGWIAAIPDVYRHAPQQLRPWVSKRCLRPAASGWLQPRVDGARITSGRAVIGARAHQQGLLLTLHDGDKRLVDHVLLGTGYAVNVAHYPFLTPLADRIQAYGGLPLLGEGLESRSVPGLHFLGAPAALSFGPIMRFVVGTWYAAPALTERIVGRRQRPLRRAF